MDILIPFGLPPAELAPDLMRSLTAPTLANLISRSGGMSQHNCDDFARALPHERLIADAFGVGGQSSPPLAQAALQWFDLDFAPGYWLLLNPVHVHIARDHLVLTDRRQLGLSEPESRELFAAAAPYFVESGRAVLYGDAQHWFVRADDWADLDTATPDAACGHNIDIWMPRGEGDRAWRKLQNEIQMLWYAHPVNQQRLDDGKPPVNSLWMWGGDSRSKAPSCTAYQAILHPTTASTELAALARAADIPLRQGDAATLLGAAPEPCLLVLDQLIGAALAADWSSWLLQMEALERAWFVPLYAAQQGGRLRHIKLIVTHANAYRCFDSGRFSAYKFWTQPTLKRLLP